MKKFAGGKTAILRDLYDPQGVLNHETFYS